ISTSSACSGSSSALYAFLGSFSSPLGSSLLRAPPFVPAREFVWPLMGADPTGAERQCRATAHTRQFSCLLSSFLREEWRTPPSTPTRGHMHDVSRRGLLGSVAAAGLAVATAAPTAARAPALSAHARGAGRIPHDVEEHRVLVVGSGFG